ncbi:flagellar biosynthesis repressor FlbT [Roseinatronobacter sp.]|uniref:flagellar biosynthesis repressor FlbT n=1 Tax=Roseinatronobacter sp. TaxID=1945755 RepID=UPI0025D1B9F3|nr:flagellar biosynthesis repressor FlbT [Rhodobaca sp.]
MTGLVIRLAPHERVLLNGAVVENGDRRASLSIKTPNANVLRLRDAIHPEQANTPVKRTCYLAQLILAGDGCAEDIAPSLIRSIEQLSQVFSDQDSRQLLERASENAINGEFYQSLKFLRLLLPREKRLFAIGVS